MQEEEADHWEFNVRACAEKLVADLVGQHGEVLAPVLVQMLHAVSGKRVCEARV